MTFAAGKAISECGTRIRFMTFHVGGLASDADDVFMAACTSCRQRPSRTSFACRRRIGKIARRIPAGWHVITSSSSGDFRSSGLIVMISHDLLLDSQAHRGFFIIHLSDAAIDVLNVYQSVSTGNRPQSHYTAKRDHMWRHLREVLRRLPQRNPLILAGHMNTQSLSLSGHVGKVHIGTNGVTRGGDQDVDQLVDLIKDFDLCLLNSWVRHARATFYSGEASSHIDHVYTRRRDADDKACCAHTVNIDYFPWRDGGKHYPVLADLCPLRLCHHAPPAPTQTWDQKAMIHDFLHVPMAVSCFQDLLNGKLEQADYNKQFCNAALEQAEEASRTGHVHDLYATTRQLAPKQVRRRVRLRGPESALLDHQGELDLLQEHCEHLFSSADSDTKAYDLQALAPYVTDAAIASNMKKIPLRKAAPPGHVPAVAWKMTGQLGCQAIEALVHTMEREVPKPSMARCMASLHSEDIHAKGAQGSSTYRSSGYRRQVCPGCYQRRIRDAVMPYVLQYTADWPQLAYLGQRSTRQAINRAFEHCALVREAVTGGKLSGLSPTRTAMGDTQVSVDMSQAFDRLDRSLLLEAMTDARILSPLQDAIMAWHQGMEYHLQHADLKTKVESTVGVRQGWKIAPVLWVLYTCCFNALPASAFFFFWTIASLLHQQRSRPFLGISMREVKRSRCENQSKQTPKQTQNTTTNQQQPEEQSTKSLRVPRAQYSKSSQKSRCNRAAQSIRGGRKMRGYARSSKPPS